MLLLLEIPEWDAAYQVPHSLGTLIGTQFDRNNPCPLLTRFPSVHFTSRVVPMTARFDFNVNLNVDDLSIHSNCTHKYINTRTLTSDTL